MRTHSSTARAEAADAVARATAPAATSAAAIRMRTSIMGMLNPLRTLGTLRLGLLGAGLLAALAAPLAASAQTLERIKTSGTLNLGFIDGVAPFSAKAADGKAAGFGIELCQPVADAVKARLAPAALNVRFVALKVDAALDSVAKGEVDLLCTPSVDTLKRRATVSYSLPVFNGGIGVLLRADSPRALRDVLNGKVAATGPIWRATVNRGLANHTYAVRAGTVTEEWVRDKTRQLNVSVHVITVDDDAKGVELVRARQADAFFAERVLLLEKVARGSTDLVVLERKFNVEPMALAMGRNDDDFRLLVDTALSKLFTSAAFPAIYTRYFGPFDDATRAAYLGFSRP
jgi:polar amino acid transport system substrate-binding protein